MSESYRPHKGSPERNPDEEGVDRFLKKAKRLVILQYNDVYPGNDLLSEGEVYIVWFSKTLQNWKALLSTTREDRLYYEVTYNGDKDESYIDMYRKITNHTVHDN